MKRIALTQRVHEIEDRNERRDCTDQRWYRLFSDLGCLPVLLPNNKDIAVEILKTTGLAGAILTGGNDLACYSGDAPERDAVEAILLDKALNSNFPVLGVCRGMQHIIHHCGGTLKRVAGHAATVHHVSGSLGERIVNSYHRWAAADIPDSLLVTAYSDDGVVEAVRHSRAPIAGIMWHPERDNIPAEADLIMIKDLLAVP